MKSGDRYAALIGMLGGTEFDKACVFDSIGVGFEIVFARCDGNCSCLLFACNSTKIPDNLFCLFELDNLKCKFVGSNPIEPVLLFSHDS